MQESSFTTKRQESSYSTPNKLPNCDQTLLPTRKVQKGLCPKGGPWLMTTPRLIAILAASLLLAVVASILVFLLTARHNSSCRDYYQTEDNTSDLSPNSSTVVIPPLRLPSDLSPQSYELTLRPDIYNGDPLSFRFSGDVKIIFKCHRYTKKVVLHSKNLTIDTDAIRLIWTNGDLVQVSSVELDTANEMIILHLREALRPMGTYGAHLSFTGSITDKPEGLFYMGYEEYGRTRYVIASQMQAAHARSVFPCMDEPQFKATFDVIIERKPGYLSMSNMPRRNYEYVDDWVADHFETTPQMSTYLLAVVLSQFQCLNRKTKTDKSVQVCSRPENLYYANMSAVGAVAIMEFYEIYYNISYPLTKISHVALPSAEFSKGVGAVENWGLVTYMEHLLVYHPWFSTTHDQLQILTHLAHEITQQWFGNLVTSRWWDDIWLTEGFATFMEMLGIEVVYPTWHAEDGFLLYHLQYVLGADSVASSHPVHRPVNSADHVDAMLDDVTYSKSACLIRMLYHFLDGDSFRNGLTDYLHTHSYGSATHQDLFNALTRQTRKNGQDLDIDDIMKTWILQQGYPIVTMEFDRVTHLVNVSQKIFLLSPSEKDKLPRSPYSYQWHVPISYITDLESDSDNYDKTWLRPNEDLVFGVPPGTACVLGNVKWRYYYRVNYDPLTWSYLTDKLINDHRDEITYPFPNFNDAAVEVWKWISNFILHFIMDKIIVQNRAQLLDDSINLARASEVSPILFLNMSVYLRQETDYLPWMVAIKAFDFLDSMLVTTAVYTKYKAFVKNLVQPAFEKLPSMATNISGHVESLKREALAEFACFHQVPSCIRQSSSVFHQWRTEYTNGRATGISADIRYTVYAMALVTGAYDWGSLFTYYLVAPPEEQMDILHALGQTNDVWQLRRYLQYALEGEVIPPESFTMVLDAVASNPQGPLLAWEFLVEHWDVIYDRFNTSSITLKHCIKIITEKFTSRFHQELVEAFSTSHENLPGPLKTVLQESLEDIRRKADWREQHLTEILRWLEARVVER